jgi:all-trans-8'-apo-beta-carotenal 15,15'-oxygenase
MTEAMALPAGLEGAQIALAEGEVAWSRCFDEPPREHGFEPLRVQGSLPRELAGRAFFHGPGMVSALGDRGAHWLDGDGVVGAFWFQNGKAAGAVRVVETQGLRAERAAGRRLFGGFARSPSSLSGRLLGQRKARASHGLLSWDGRLLALGDGAPVELDPGDLACRGEVDPVQLGLGRAAPHLRRAAGRRGVFGLAAAPLASRVDVLRLGDEGPAERVGTIDVGRPTLLHDFALTSRHLVMAAPPIRARGWGGWPGAAPLADRLRWDASAGTEIIVASLDEPERARRFTVSALYATHFCNAFERSGELVVDLVAADDFDGVDGWQRAIASGLGGAPLRTRLWRIVLDLATGAARGAPILEQSCEAPVIAPAVSGEAYRLVWMVGHSTSRAAHGLPDRLLEVDVESGRTREIGFGEGCYPSQPVFVPRDGGESGWLVTQVYDGRRHRSFAAVVDTCAFDAPIARAHFDHALPYAMHGSWIEAERGG